MVVDLQSRCFYFVHVRFRGFAILADGRPKAIIQVVLESIDSVCLLLLKCHPVGLNHPDQVHASLLLIALTSLNFVDLTL